ncbi:hypothetical protein AAG906_023253 [Vitis piasezkii]|uniref:transcription factor TCP13 n=1 Tax=Vitis riparia TaxID=96939 RepID=UPI00155A3D16|nr:transcription factor TCP13 [Vitis riparia]
MTTSSREADFSAKLEGDESDARIAKNSSTSTPWLRLKDPRIVRVSRAYGGKDRHSKVCTVRGLRDRRVRLSVPTAIQLYDLQDRLGLNQPSKVVDWLLNAAKHEIDELPPLQMPPGNFVQSHQPMITSLEVGASQFNKEELKISNGIDWEDPSGLPRSSFWGSNAFLRAKSKEVPRENVNEKVNWMKRNEEKQEGIEGHGGQVSSNIFPPRTNQSSLPGLLSSSMPYGPYYHLEPSNLSLSTLGSHGFTSQTEDLHNFSVVPLPSSLSLTSGSQVLVCPPGATQSYFPPHVPTSMEFDPRQINHFQLLSSSSQNILPNALTPPLYSIGQPVRPLHLSMAHKIHHSQSINGSHPNKDS